MSITQGAVDRRTISVFGAIIMLMSSSSALSSSQTGSAYRYDPLGRLSKACLALAGSGQLTNYAMDSADNRQLVNSTTTTIYIPQNSSIYSADNRFHLTMQSDGNLVLYGPSGSLWSSGTSGSGAVAAGFQSDGNLVLYTKTAPIWSTVTAPNYCATLALQNDGNLVIYNIDGAAIWSTNTGGH